MMKKLIAPVLVALLVSAPVVAQYIPGGGGTAGGGSGTVTNVATGAGLTGGPITTTGTISATQALGNSGAPITGTTYTIDCATDAATELLFTGTAASAWDLAAPTGACGAGIGFGINNRGTDDITLTATGDIDGAATKVLTPGQGTYIYNDGSTWYSNDGAATGGSGVPSIAGTSNQINESGSPGATTLSLSSTLVLPGTLTSATAGAASTPAVTFSGAPYTAGTATTNFPLVNLWTTGASAPTTWSTGGSFIGINAPNAFSGRPIDYHVNGGASLFNIQSSGGINTADGINLGANGASTVAIARNATNRLILDSNGVQFINGVIYSSNSNSSQLSNSAASSTVPTLIPNRSSSTTGWGSQASGNISGIISAVERTRFTDEGIMPVQATAPTCTGTGTPTITTGSTDQAGQCTAGTTATSVVITFNRTHTNAPFCVVTSQTATAAISYTVSTTAITVTQVATSGNLIDYICFMRT